MKFKLYVSDCIKFILTKTSFWYCLQILTRTEQACCLTFFTALLLVALVWPGRLNITAEKIWNSKTSNWKLCSTNRCQIEMPLFLLHSKWKTEFTWCKHFKFPSFFPLLQHNNYYLTKVYLCYNAVTYISKYEPIVYNYKYYSVKERLHPIFCKK